MEQDKRSAYEREADRLLDQLTVGLSIAISLQEYELVEKLFDFIIAWRGDARLALEYPKKTISSAPITAEQVKDKGLPKPVQPTQSMKFFLYNDDWGRVKVTADYYAITPFITDALLLTASNAVSSRFLLSDVVEREREIEGIMRVEVSANNQSFVGYSLQRVGDKYCFLTGLKHAFRRAIAGFNTAQRKELWQELFSVPTVQLMIEEERKK